MSPASDESSAAMSQQYPRWVWWICLLLLLATMINYLDRQALTVAASRIKGDFQLSNEQYGRLEMSFGIAFAVGQTLMGVIADRVSVRWFYPLILALWSLMGFLTGWAETFLALLICRSLLGLFEGGNWPCGLTVVQRILPPNGRALGNGLLQGGGAIGAILTPLVMFVFLTDEVGSWRIVFQLIGASGVIWIILWLVSVRGQKFVPSSSLPGRVAESHLSADLSEADEESLLNVFLSRRFFVVLCIGICCNFCWHMIRVWMPLYLQEAQGLNEQSMLLVNAGYFIAADIGCWIAGGATLWMTRRGWTLPAARRWVYLSCSLLTTLSVATLFLPAWSDVVILILVGAGCLGQFPTFYALSQDLSQRHQGTVIGVMGTSAWLVLAVLHPLFGRWVDDYGSYDMGIAVVGLVPLVSCAALWFVWPTSEAMPWVRQTK